MKTSASLSVRSLMLLIVLLFITPSAWALDGQGTQDNPYKIYDANDLRQFRNIVNGTNGETQNAGAWAELHSNIDDLGIWSPIGTSARPYTGTFDGRGHSISGMSIQRYTTSCQGLFGCIENATVMDFKLSGSMTSGKTIGNDSELREGSATVVGSALGSSLVKYIASSVNWDIYSVTQTHLGGIVGNLAGASTVRGCTYSGTLNAGASKDCLGGIVGYAKPGYQSLIMNCFFCGKISTSPAADTTPVIGGILGYINDGNGVFGGVRGCYSCGTLSAGDAKTTYVSGIIGWARGKSIHDKNVKDNYYLSDTASRTINAESTSDYDSKVNKPIIINVKANNESYGSVSTSYIYPSATTPTLLKVEALNTNPDYGFDQWSDGGEQTHDLALNNNIILTATFQKIEPKAVYLDNTLTFYFDGVTHTGTTYSLPEPNTLPGWYKYNDQIYTVVFDDSFSRYRPTSCDRWFYQFFLLKTITGMTNLNTSEVTNMYYMFFKCHQLTSLTIGDFDMSKVTDASHMFDECEKLNTLTLKSVPYLKNGTFNSKFDGNTVNCELDANSTIYEGTNYLPKITNCNHYFSTDEPGREATCTDYGYTKAHRCKVCNAVVYEGKTPALEHEYQNPVWSWADDASNATLTLTCSHDASHKVVLDKDSDPKVIITPGENTPATCTAMGKKTYNASVTYNEQQFTADSKQIDIAIDPNSHTPDDDGYCTGCHQPMPPTQASDGYYQINNRGELLWYLNQVNTKNEITINGRLMKDIVINDGTFDADGTYTAGESNKPLVDGFMTGHKLYDTTFDGNNHAIVGLYGSGSGNCGLFAQILLSTVKDLTLRNCYLKSTGDKVGAIGGDTYNSNITNCFATDCYIVGNRDVGGIVGFFDGNGCTLSHCGSNSTVNGNTNAGGVCGNTYIGSTISYCYATGKVSSSDTVGGVCGYAGTGTTISYCYATGTVSGDSYVGGVCGLTEIGVTISYCYATGAVSGNGFVGGVCGELKWDFKAPDILGHLTNCYFTGQVSKGGFGICGNTRGNDNQVTLCYTTVAADEGDELYSAARCVEGGVALDRFKSGEIAWLLNGSVSLVSFDYDDVAQRINATFSEWKAGPTNGTQPWRQNLPSATSGQTADTTPVLDTTHATVYASMPCQISFSNSPGVTIDHTPDDDGICTKCHQFVPPTQASDGYYQINNRGELLWYLNKLDTNGEITINGRLMKDIVINDGTFDAQGNYTAGTSNKPLVDGFMTGHKLFQANFDGNNHAIVGLYGCGSGNCGLFALMVNATVKDLTLRNCYLKSTGNNVGAIGGYARYSNITNCYATDCYIVGNDYVGGIVGQFAGDGCTLTHCGSNSTVSGNKNVGGVCGHADIGPTISYSYATGKVSGNTNVGGVCGDANIGTTISYCYAMGTVSGDENVGGVCGKFNWSSEFPDILGHLTSCYFTGQVSEGGKGICGETCSNDNQVTLCYTTVADAGADSKSRCVEGGVSLDRFKSGEIAWLLNGTIENGKWSAGPTTGTQPWRQNLPSATSGQTADTTPVLDTTHATVYASMPCQISFSNSADVIIDHTPDDDGICTKCHKTAEPTQSADGYYEIYTPNQLLWYLNYLKNLGSIDINGRLMADIIINDGTFDAKGNYTPGTSGKPLVEGFRPGHTLLNVTFDGNNHAIVGLYGCGDGKCGLFAEMVNATVQDLTLRNCYLKSTGDNVGAIGGYTYYSNITNCYATDCYIVGNDNVGGIVGQFEGNGCTLSHCGSNSTVSGNNNVGGVCGQAKCGTISYCYATGTVSGNTNVGGVCGGIGNAVTISYCYAMGTVSGDENVGGVCGSIDLISSDPNFLSQLTSCYFTGEVSEGGKGICGYTNNPYLITLCYTTVADAGPFRDGSFVEGGVSLERFKSGEIAWLMNGSVSLLDYDYDNETGNISAGFNNWEASSTDGTLPWRQAIGIDDTPRLIGPMLYQETSTGAEDSETTYYNYVDQNRDHKLTIGDITQLIYSINNCFADSNMDVDGKAGVDQGDVEALVRIVVGK